MSAPEFVAFWGDGCMASVATVSDKGEVHAGPLEIRLVDGKLMILTFGDAVRRRDHRAHPRCDITAWEDAYRAVIAYGTAVELPRDAPETTALVTIEVTPTRIYAIRPPPGHHAAG